MKRRTFQHILGWSLALSPLTGRAILQENQPALLSPKKLQPGDKVGLIAPGSPCPEDKIEKALANTRLLGLEPVLGKYVRNKYGYLAGHDGERLQDLHEMFRNQEIKAIWCIRGGYGCTRLLPLINYDLIRQNPKIFIGYSDITALHLAFYQNTGLSGFHGPVAGSTLTPYALIHLKQALFKTMPAKIPIHVEEDNAFDAYSIQDGLIKGKLIGGNLSLLAALAGTSYCPNYSGNLVFIEDIGEKPYRIDRMLTQLFQSTDLANAAGIIFGIFVDCEAKKNAPSLTLEETLRNQILPQKFPAFYGFSFGHMDNQCTIPIGYNALFDTRKKVLEITALTDP